MFTQCPQCLTYFQVTPEHLKVAQGNVRCGQCQNVFSALGNLTELPPEAVTQRPPEPPARKKRNIVKRFDDFANDLKQKTDVESNKPATTRKITRSRNLATTPSPPTKGLGAAIEAMNKLNRASSTLQTLDNGRRTIISQMKHTPKTRPRNISPQAKDFVQEIEDIEDIVLETPAAARKPAPKQLKKAIPAVIKKKTAPRKKKRAPTARPAPMRPPGLPGKEIAIAGSNSDIDLQKALMAIDELDITGGNTQRKNNPLSDDFFNPRGAATNNLPTNNFNGGRTQSKSDIKIKPLGRPNPGRALVPQPAPSAAMAANNMGMQLIPKPLLADFQQAQSARAAHAAHHKGFNVWVVGCVVLMVIFLGQTIYFKHDDLAKNQSIRPWIETFCEQADCEVSLPYEVKHLELLGQDIRSHPKISKALLVSVTIINNARYVQAYPGLQITFTDMNDQKVAMRRFEPHEFLSSKTDIESGMPSNTPVQVEIKILDPGSKAVNFEFSFFNAG